MPFTEAHKYQPLHVVEGRGVSISQALLLREHSAGIYDIGTFVDSLSNNPRPLSFAIGLSWNQFFEATRTLKIPDYWDAYREILGPKAPPNTDKFMQAIHQDQYSIVFFVPRHVLHPEVNKSITSQEFQWCLDHHDKIASLEFVFGLYDMPPTKVKEYIHQRRKALKRIQLLSRVFNPLSIRR